MNVKISTTNEYLFVEYIDDTEGKLNGEPDDKENFLIESSDDSWEESDENETDSTIDLSKEMNNFFQ